MKSFKKALYVFLAAGLILFSSCTDFIDVSSNGSSYIRINATTARTILPDWPLDTMTDFSLKGIKTNGKAEKVLAEYSTYAQLVSASIPVESGTWYTLTLVSKDGESYFSSTLSNVEITSGENSLIFNLKKDAELTPSGTGTADVKFNLGQTDEVKAVKGGLYTRAGDEELESFGLEALGITQTDGTYYAEYQKSNIPEGTYRLKVWFYADTECTVLVTTHSELVEIAAGNTSNAERNIYDRVYIISYEGIEGAEFAEGVNLKTAFISKESGTSITLPVKGQIFKKSYIFEGWYSDENYETKITKLELTSRDITLYAKWILGYEIDLGDGVSPNNKAYDYLVFDIPGDYTIRVTGSHCFNINTIKSTVEDYSVILDMKRCKFEKIPDGQYNCTIWGNEWYRRLSSIILPESVTSIGNTAFRWCSSLTSIELPASITSIGNYAFEGCSLTSIELPASVTSIGNYAFSGCSSLTSIELSASVTSIGGQAFQGCSSLTSIELPASVTSIGPDAFRWCRSLTSIEIPDSVTSISSSAFYGCSSLTSIEIPDTVTRIGEGAFYNCSSLTSVSFADTESIWYYTSNYKFTEGTEIGPMSATDTAANATLLKSTYEMYYLYNEKYGN